jgi:urease accessory protein
LTYRAVAEIVGNVAGFAVGTRALERVAVPSDAMTRRVLRLPTSIGDLGITLDGTRLRDGDIVYADASRVIAVQVLPDDVLVVHPTSIAQAIDVAHALGNRHVPIQRDGDVLVIAFAPALAALLDQLGVRYERTARVLAEPFRHAAAPHAH